MDVKDFIEERILAEEVEAYPMNITPDTARYMLGKMKNNRALRPYKVKQYAREMQLGRWKLNNDALCFDKNGVLINGQHRLNAIIMSGITVQMMVCFGLDPKAYLTMDQGGMRSVRDLWMAEGNKKAGASHAAVVNRYFSLKEGRLALSNASNSILSSGSKSKKDIMDFFMQNEELVREIVTDVRKWHKESNPLTHSDAGGFMLYLIKEKKHAKDEVFSFMKALFTGSGAENCRSVIRANFILRRSDLTQNGRKAAAARQAITIQAWNAWHTKNEKYDFDKDREEECL